MRVVHGGNTGSRALMERDPQRVVHLLLIQLHQPSGHDRAGQYAVEPGIIPAAHDLRGIPSLHVFPEPRPDLEGDAAHPK